MSYAEELAADRRLSILRFLIDANGAPLSVQVIQISLRSIGHNPISRSTIRDEFAWLESQGLIVTEVVKDMVTTARLTEYGADVAAGDESHAGVKRPTYRSG